MVKFEHLDQDSKSKWKQSSWRKNIKKDIPDISSISFNDFNDDNVDRDSKVSSISLRIKDIEPFEKNVRRQYDEEDMENLRKSIQNRDDIGNIDVYHIEKGDRFIVSDWHRTLRAYTELYWEDHTIEVIVRGKAKDLTPDVELRLMEIWFITSNTKKKLWFYEEAYSIKKYIEQLDNIDPNKPPHKISQKPVYEALWLTKSKAMKYNGLFQRFSLDKLTEFENEEISYNLLLKLSEIKNQAKFAEALDVVRSWRVETPKELETFIDIKEEIISDDNTWKLDKEEVQVKAVEEIWKIKLREEYKSVKTIKTYSKKICKELLGLDISKLNKEEMEILSESIKNVKIVIDNKKL